MLRQLLCRLLGADLQPSVDWGEIGSLEALARHSIEAPRLFGRTEAVETVLCANGDQLLLFRKWQRSGAMQRVGFARRLDAPQMRITEFPQEPATYYRLELTPAEGTRVAFDAATPTWFGLWRNEPTHDDLGSGICFLESAEREPLVHLRSRLLDGNVPESLLTEEAMWQRMNSLPEDQRRAAMAALVMQQHAAQERRFEENFPDIGPVPDELQPLENHVQQQLDRIRQMAASNPVDPELANLMQRFQRDVTNRAATDETHERPD